MDSKIDDFLGSTPMESKFLNVQAKYVKEYEKEFDLDQEDVPDNMVPQFKSFVVEEPILRQNIRNLVEYSRGNITEKGIQNESDAFNVLNRTVFILEQYLEQPSLLDPHLEMMITPIMERFQEVAQESYKTKDYTFSSAMKKLSDLIYYLCKIRGDDRIIKFLPHDVVDLEPVLEFLDGQDGSNLADWKDKYVLMVWLSMIILVPFDLESVDTEGNKAIFERILTNCRTYLTESGLNREASAMLLGRFLTRPDITKMGYLKSFIEELLQKISDCRLDVDKVFHVMGCYNALVEIFKYGHRKELIPVIPLVFELLGTEGSTDEAKKPAHSVGNTNLRKLKIKLAHRVGLTYLKPIVARWRYQRGQRSLLDNVKTTISSKLISNVTGGMSEKSDSASKTALDNTPEDDEEGDEDEDDDIDGENLELIFEQLLTGLRDKDTIVRWAAAKGIGRLTGRLQMEMADDVVESILELFTADSENSWHGGCLALAELARRGLLLPTRLKQVFPILFKALHFDLNFGTHSVGGNVRDAACYLSWSFARAYDSSILTLYAEEHSKVLLNAALYDREVNCRRAASAAFQEHVGRTGSIPHGIELLTEADYFTLGNRLNAYLNVSTFVAQYEVYCLPMVELLVAQKLNHWEMSLRQLTSQTLSVLTPFQPQFMINDLIPRLATNCVSPNLNLRHGSTLAVAEILVGLCGKSHLHYSADKIKRIHEQHLNQKEQKIIKDSENKESFQKKYFDMQKSGHVDLISDDIIKTIKSIVIDIDKKRLYRGKGGEIMRGAVCRLIECISLAELKLDRPVLTKYQEIVDDCLRHPKEEIQVAAKSAQKGLARVYYTKMTDALDKKILQKWLPLVSSDPSPCLTRGYSMGLGALSAPLLQSKLDDILARLYENLIPKQGDEDDAETRKYAVESLGEIIATLGVHSLSQEVVTTMFNNLIAAADDYSVDKRGDVGSWVREASMRVLFKIFQLLYNSEVPQEEVKVVITDEMKVDFVRLLLKQLVEKIDKIRQVAGDLLQQFWKEYLHAQTELPAYDALKSMVINDDAEHVFQWSIPSYVFPLVVPMLSHQSYTKAILSGLIVSVGGLTESTLRSSTDSLNTYIGKVCTESDRVETMTFFLNTLMEIFKEKEKHDRVTVPLMKTLEGLLTNIVIPFEEMGDILETLYTLTRAEVFKSKNLVKVASAVGVYMGMLTFKSTREKALTIMLTYLCHSYPKVRKTTAEKLYLFCLSLDDPLELVADDDQYDEVLMILTETPWMKPIADIRATRDKLFPLLNVTPPVKKEKTVSETTQKKKKEDESYAALVKEVGY